MFTCTGKYTNLEKKTVETRNFTIATHYKPSTSSRRWRGTARLHNIYWNFSLGGWKEAVCHGNSSGGWQPVSGAGGADERSVAWRRDPGVLCQGSRVPAQRLGRLVGDTSCPTAGTAAETPVPLQNTWNHCSVTWKNGRVDKVYNTSEVFRWRKQGFRNGLFLWVCLNGLTKVYSPSEFF